MSSWLNKLLGQSGPKLIKKKMLPKQSSYEIICPYCFERFSHEDALFRASASDDIVPEMAAVPDREYSAYWNRMRDDDELEIMRPIIDPVKLAPSQKRYDGEVLVGITDNLGNRTNTRICPYCHNALPASAGRAPANIISVIGSTQVGKTFYILNLIKTLTERTAASFDASCSPLTGEIAAVFNESYSGMATSLIKATDKKYQKPLIYRFVFNDPKKPDVLLCFYDFPGEAIHDEDFLRIKANNIRNSSGLLLLIDPLQLEGISALLRRGGDRRYTTPEEVIVELYNLFICEEKNGRTELPTAVILSKSDELRPLSSVQDGRRPLIHPESTIFRNFEHSRYLDLNQIDNINNDVKSLLAATGAQNLLNMVAGHFVNFSCFAVSSLGYPTENGRVVSGIQPFRVDEPFLWLLWQMGYIDATYDDTLHS